MDTSSELVHSLLPLFMVSTLGASMASIGIIEGIAESTALIVKIFSGTLSDYLGRHKPLTLVGYGMAALSKPLFALAGTLGLVFSARFIDRIGKGIRGAPRDAMLSELAPAEIRGAAFGLRQSLDTVGAILGPLLALAGMMVLADNIRAVLWIAVIPAILSVLILAFGVKEPRVGHVKAAKSALHLMEIRLVGKQYWQLVAIAGVLTLARLSDAFLILKAKDSGMPIALVPLVLVMMNIVYALAAYPAGMWSDTMRRKKVLLGGVGFLIIAHLILGLTNNFWTLFLGIAFWGLHLGFSQGLLAAMVTDTTPSALRGTAYGVFNLVSGLAMLMGGVSAGYLWDLFGSSLMFFAGAVFTSIAFLGLCFVPIEKP